MDTGMVISRWRWLPGIYLLFIVLLCAGCAKPKSSLRPYARSDFRPGKMAILPFDNLSAAQGAAKALENLVLVEFLKLPNLTIIEPGEVTTALSEARVRLATNIPRETVIKLGEDLGVDLLMVGVVHEHELKRFSGAGGAGEVPVVALSLRIIETKTGSIVWAANANRAGNDRETVFGIGRVQSINELAANAASDLAQACALSFSRT
jgi:TolB-like protein